MAACESGSFRWGETAITEIVISRAASAVTVLPFTQAAESTSGADWIWWWIDGSSAYGMLVQAKRLTVANDKWHFDFEYSKGAQRSKLISTAEHLGLTPVYALYLGTGEYRRWQPCPERRHRRRCGSCVKRSVSLMPALLANRVMCEDSESVYERSVALEELLTPEALRPVLIPGLSKQLTPDLRNFLQKPQAGVRAVTRAMFDRVLRVRAGQFAVASAPRELELRDGEHDRLGSVFQDLPTDTGHWGVRYFEHVLSPLHHSPPSYVLELLSGDSGSDFWGANRPENVAGVVVVQLAGTAETTASRAGETVPVGLSDRQE